MVARMLHSRQASVDAGSTFTSSSQFRRLPAQPAEYFLRGFVFQRSNCELKPAVVRTQQREWSAAAPGVIKRAFMPCNLAVSAVGYQAPRAIVGFTSSPNPYFSRPVRPVLNTFRQGPCFCRGAALPQLRHVGAGVAGEPLLRSALAI